MPTFNETRATTFRSYVAEQGIVMSNWLKTFHTFWSHSSIFALEKQPKNLNFQSFLLPLGDPLVPTFNETRETTFTNYLAEQGIAMSNWWKTFHTFWSHCSICALQKQPKNLNFQSFVLPLGDPLVPTFNETRATTFRSYVAEQGIVMSNWLKTFHTFWSHSSIFALEQQLKNLNFQSDFFHL